MLAKISTWLNKKYPQNYIIRKPYAGAMIFLIVCICFALIYKPFQIHESRFFNTVITIALYCLIQAVPLIVFVKILKRTRYFSDAAGWTILKEISAILILLLSIGITVYFAGFLLEPPHMRWTLSTFFNSVITASLISVIPLAFFSIINYRYLFVTDLIKNFNTDINSMTPEQTEELIHIASQLKKEELVFYPGQFLYAESDGNYIIFHLNVENHIRKIIIRNSISNIEQQLSPIPYFFRIHRAFIVNIKKISSQKGNTLGYRLKFPGTDVEIPVSRQKTRDFDEVMKRYR